MKQIAEKMVSKGILAADESVGTMGKRLKSVGLENTEQNRWSWRNAMFATTPKLENFISGVILNEETVFQQAVFEDSLDKKDNLTFPQMLSMRGIVPGVKVDKGAKGAALFPGEKITEGLDGLRERLQKFKEAGCQFTKWRAVIQANAKDEVSSVIVAANAHALARFAALSQEAGMVPIVEPEVIIDNEWGIERVEGVTTHAIDTTIKQLQAFKVDLEAIILKPNMVMAGYKHYQQTEAHEVAQETLKVLGLVLPSKVPGVAFLSGGQPDESSVENLRVMNASLMEHPWRLTFSYGRGLQSESLKVWSEVGSRPFLGKNAEEVFLNRLEEVYKASLGE